MKYQSTLRAHPSRPVDLQSIDPGGTGGFPDKVRAGQKLERDIERLRGVQNTFTAAGRYALLVVFQGMDTAGKDSAVSHVMSGMNPQGVSVTSFKQPSPEELRHDYLWRCAKSMPERGRIGIFNRSYYEDVIVTRVHRELLGSALPKSHAGQATFWRHRYAEINDYERYLVRNGTHIVKFFLHISKEEQRKRLLARLDDREKQWKFSLGDVQQRAFWNDYRAAYEGMLGKTSSSWAPWYIVPSDHKWFTRVAVADILVSKMKSLHLQYPSLPKELKSKLRSLRAELAKP
ncbi:MAG TPA: polyphosphate kinase 2 family protein [Candidatus Eremiobacteraceae bacterium]